MAKLFKTNKIRIFSYLKDVSYNSSVFANTLQAIDKLAVENSIYFLLENEPVCNLMHFNDTLELLSTLDVKNIKLLVDVGNIYKIGHEVNLEEFKQASKYCDYYHLKDWKDGRFVALGEGIITFQPLLEIIGEFNKEFTLSLETHTKNKIDVLNSLVYLKKICQKFQ